jgi:Cu(I)/Ag(I) efflux system membrane fusion protein/cobalt-zinc-cadmium efflux system membrane fusion protein
MRSKSVIALSIFLLLATVVVVALLVDANRRRQDSPAGHDRAAMDKSPRRLWHCGMHPQVVQDHPGDCPICHMALTPIDANSAADKGTERKVLYWWDPMLGPGSKSDHPGKSAMGMDMVPVYAESAGPQVRIDPAVVQNMGVRTAIVTRGPLHKTVRTVGMLKLPEPGLHDVSLKVGGWIDKLYADQEGMHVAQGEPLFDLYSPDLQVVEEELIASVKAEKSLPADSSGELRREAHSLVESSRRKLLLWDVAEQDIDTIAKADKPPRNVPFRSPATGHVEEKAIVQGSAVQPMTRLLRVADHTKMWLDAEVYMDQLPAVKEGQEVAATVDGAPGKTWKGTISFIYPHVEHMTRTLMVRITLDNPDFALKPGMYASVEIMTQPIAEAITTPAEAVIDTGERQIVFIADGNGHFTPRKVRTGLAGDDDRIVIVEGLVPGETVVTSGQFLMDVESRTIEATQKLTAGPTTNP